MSQPVNSKNVSQKNGLNFILIFLIIVILGGLISLSLWKFVFSGNNKKNTTENNNSKISKILDERKSNYSIVGTWEGNLCDAFYEITITEAHECIIKNREDIANSDIWTVNADLTDDNVLTIRGRTYEGQTINFQNPIVFDFFAIDEYSAVIMERKNSEQKSCFATFSTSFHRTSVGEGVVGTWKANGEDPFFKEMTFSDKKRCDIDSSGKCYGINYEMDDGNGLYYDDNFIYAYLGKNYEMSEYAGKLFGMLTYEVNAKSLNVYGLSVFNRK